MTQEVQEVKQAQYLGVHCQSCGQPIPVPDRVARQVTVEGESDAGGLYVSSLLNLRCRTCHKEHFYDVSEAQQIEGSPRSFAHPHHGQPTRHSHPDRARAACN